MGIHLLHNRIYRQRVFPECIKAHSLIHRRNNQRVFESNHLGGLAIVEVLVGILQSIDTVFTRSDTSNRKTSAAIGTTYTFERSRCKGRIRQIGMHTYQHTFHRFQIECIQYGAGYRH